MRPRIGVNCNVKAGARTLGDGRLLTLNPDYVSFIARAGGLPLLLPPLPADGAPLEPALEAMLAAVDGLVLSGGDDMNPAAYGQPPHPETRLLDPQRDAFDQALARAALARDLPVLAVCGGMQLVNVVLGGTLHQHLADLRGEGFPGLLPIHDAQETREVLHPVFLTAGTWLAGLLGDEPLITNSRHHQAIDRVGRGLKVAAVAADGVIEALEGVGRRFLVGVQWHPEEQAGDARQQRLFDALVRACCEITGGNGAAGP